MGASWWETFTALGMRRALPSAQSGAAPQLTGPARERNNFVYVLHMAARCGADKANGGRRKEGATFREFSPPLPSPIQGPARDTKICSPPSDHPELCSPPSRCTSTCLGGDNPPPPK